MNFQNIYLEFQLNLLNLSNRTKFEEYFDTSNRTQIDSIQIFDIKMAFFTTNILKNDFPLENLYFFPKNYIFLLSQKV